MYIFKCTLQSIIHSSILLCNYIQHEKWFLKRTTIACDKLDFNTLSKIINSEKKNQVFNTCNWYINLPFLPPTASMESGSQLVGTQITTLVSVILLEHSLQWDQTMQVKHFNSKSTFIICIFIYMLIMFLMYMIKIWKTCIAIQVHVFCKSLAVSLRKSKFSCLKAILAYTYKD